MRRKYIKKEFAYRAYRERFNFFIYSDIGMSTSFDIIIIKAIQHNGKNKASKKELRSKTNPLLYDRSEGALTYAATL